MSLDPQTMPEQDKLPEIRRVVSLEGLGKIGVTKKTEKIPKKEGERSSFDKVGFVIKLTLVLAFIAVIGYQLQRYQALSKQWFDLIEDRNTKVGELKKDLAETQLMKDEVTKSKEELSGEHLKLEQDYKNLSEDFKIYRRSARKILFAKFIKIIKMSMNITILTARSGALTAQNAGLLAQNQEKENQIKKLTEDLVGSIGHQEVLVKENMNLKNELQRLKESAIVSQPVDAGAVSEAQNAGK